MNGGLGRPIPGVIRVAGHFGEIVQGRLGGAGPVALVTLPCPVLAAHLTLRPGPFRAPPGFAPLALRLMRALGRPAQGRIGLRLDMPLGGGAGGSTAALVALARALGESDPARIARACRLAEGASDPLMFADPAARIWASRLGRVLAPLPPSANWPGLAVIGGFWGRGQRTQARDQHFADISDLIADLGRVLGTAHARADAAGAARALAALASTSARRNLALRGPAGDPLPDLAQHLGALGFALAHTGSARALLFPPGRVPPQAAQILRQAGFSQITQFQIGRGR